MNVLIKGMEMPKSCSECCLSKLCPTGENLICNYILSTVPWDEKPFDCPLIPVPEHGDLIDRDVFIKSECNSCDGACELVSCDCLNCKADCRCDFMKNIADAPVVIPASEEKT